MKILTQKDKTNFNEDNSEINEKNWLVVIKKL